jgi:hypothetical protein
MSNVRPEGRQNRDDNVFDGLLVGEKEASLLATYLAQHDFSQHTRKAVVSDVRKFVRWFIESNRETFILKRVTTRDV